MEKIKIIYEDENLMVIDKPVGMVVHPPFAKASTFALQASADRSGGKPEDRGYTQNTIVDWLLEKYPEIKNLNWPDKNRVGIVHRLDKDTSGVLILAKNPQILEKLQDQFRERKIEKEYLALVLGKVEKGGEISAAVGRHPKKERQVTKIFASDKLKPSKTSYDIVYLASLDINSKTRIDLTLLKVTPETGRMHQIRVHLKYLGYPILGDQTYFTKPSKRISKNLGVPRQFLHADKIKFRHPKTGKMLEFQSELPANLKKILNKLHKKI